MSQVTTQPPETQSTAQTQTSGSQSGNVPPRKKGLGCCLMKLCLLLLLVAGGLAAGFLVNRNKSDENFNAYIEEAIAGGTALTVEEVVEKEYGPTNRTLDTSKDWQVAIDGFGSEEYRQAIEGVPYVGVNVPLRWPPTSWNELDASKRFLRDHRRLLLQLQLACSGTAVWQVEPIEKNELPAESIDALNKAWDCLVLSCYVSAHERQLEDLVIRLVSCLNFGGCLALHPSHQLQRLEFEQRGMELLFAALGQIEFNERELEKLRNAVNRNVDWKPIRSMLRYQRAIRLTMYNDLENFRKSWLFKEMQENPQQAEFIKNLDINMKYSPFSGDDAVQFLEHMNSIESLLEGNPVEQAIAVADKEQEIWNSTPSGLEKYKKPTAHSMVPRMSDLVKATGDVVAARNALLAALAVDRYRFVNQVFPDSLQQASDEFLSELPLDLYTGEPIRMKGSQRQLYVMSLGPNKTDDNLQGDDIGMLLKLQKWNALTRGVQESD